MNPYHWRFTLLVLLAWSQFALCDQPLAIVPDEPADKPYVKTEQGYMVPYTVQIPGTDAVFDMVPIPGGKYLMGSSADEDGHQEPLLRNDRMSKAVFYFDIDPGGLKHPVEESF